MWLLVLYGLLAAGAYPILYAARSHQRDWWPTSGNLTWLADASRRCPQCRDAAPEDYLCDEHWEWCWTFAIGFRHWSIGRIVFASLLWPGTLTFVAMQAVGDRLVLRRSRAFRQSLIAAQQLEAEQQRVAKELAEVDQLLQ